MIYIVITRSVRTNERMIAADGQPLSTLSGGDWRGQWAAGWPSFTEETSVRDANACVSDDMHGIACSLGHVSMQLVTWHLGWLCAEATRDETGFHSGYPECAAIVSEITAKTYFVDTWTTSVMESLRRTRHDIRLDRLVGVHTVVLSRGASLATVYAGYTIALSFHMNTATTSELRITVSMKTNMNDVQITDIQFGRRISKIYHQITNELNIKWRYRHRPYELNTFLLTTS